jgi:hypothetical protein
MPIAARSAASQSRMLSTGQDVGQRRLAGAVRAHDGRHLASLHGQVQAADDLGAVFGDASVQVSYFKHGGLQITK